MIKKISGALGLLGGLLCFNVAVLAQTEETSVRLPMDEKSGLVSYKSVNESAGTPAGELYRRSLRWANSYYKNPADVIRERDSLAGKVVCKARYKIMNPADKKGLQTDGGIVMYTLTLQFKEGRYRYEMTEINWKQTSYYPIEKWMDKKDPYYKPEFEYYLQQVNDESRKIIKSLEESMKVGEVQVKDTW